MKYSSYINNSLNKITNIVMDSDDAFIVNNKSDLLVLNKISKKKWKF